MTNKAATIAIAERVAHYLCMVSAINDQKTECTSLVSVFGTEGIVPISILEYVRRIAQHTNISGTAWALALAYVLRLERCENAPSVRVLRRSAHRLLAVALTLSTKHTDDNPNNNAALAPVFGLTPKELSALEVHATRLINIKSV
jgi:hypothetical protein